MKILTRKFENFLVKTCDYVLIQQSNFKNEYYQMTDKISLNFFNSLNAKIKSAIFWPIDIINFICRNNSVFFSFKKL